MEKSPIDSGISLQPSTEGLLTDLQRLEQEPDFILIKRFGFSLKKLTERYSDGAPENIIAAALGITTEEVEQKYQNIIKCLRALVDVE